MKTKSLIILLMTVVLRTAWSQTMERQETDAIQFSIEVANQRVADMNVPVTLNINHGQPSYLAILVDDTNFQSDANWTVYTSSNLTVNLGLARGLARRVVWSARAWGRSFRRGLAMDTVEIGFYAASDHDHQSHK